MSDNWATILPLQTASWPITVGEECSTYEVNWKKRWDENTVPKVGVWTEYNINRDIK